MTWINFVVFFYLLFVYSNRVLAQTCIITVPQQPLTAQGLATPYLQTGCNQGQGTATFAHGVVLDLDTGVLAVYNPLVVDQALGAAIPPAVPLLPQNHVVGIWFGTNGGATQLVSSSTVPGMDSLQQGDCVNGGGAQYSIFGQFASCNSQNFWAAARRLQVAGKLKVPQPGLDFQGNPCPTTHDFGIVDQDPSDNVNTRYLLTADGKTAQKTPVNVQTLGTGTFTEIGNGSDEVLITLVNAAIGCAVDPNLLPLNLADATATQRENSLVINELMASMTMPPVATVPSSDPMTINGVTPDIDKTNAYRLAVGQAPIINLQESALKPFCDNLFAVGSVRIANWLPKLLLAASPDPAQANLGFFILNRFFATVGINNFNCSRFYPAGKPIPLRNVLDANNNLNFNPNGQPLPQFIGATAYTQSNVNDRLDALNFIVNGNAPANPVQAAQIAPAGGAGTTTNTTAFSGMWFGIGIGIGAAIILLLDLFFLLYKQSKQRPSSSVNVALGRV